MIEYLVLGASLAKSLIGRSDHASEEMLVCASKLRVPFNERGLGFFPASICMAIIRRTIRPSLVVTFLVKHCGEGRLCKGSLRCDWLSVTRN